MLKAQKYSAYHLPYVFLISRILEYKGVSVDEEHTQAIQSIGTEIGETTFCQMGFVSRGRMLIHKDEDNQDEEDDDMNAHMAEPIRIVAPSQVGLSTMPSVLYEICRSELMVIHGC